MHPDPKGSEKEGSSAAEAVAVVLAAGRGTRMGSALPKVLHPVAGRSMLDQVLESVRAAGCSRIVVVVGHEAEMVQERTTAPDVTWVRQTEQLGTGHALAQVEGVVAGAATLLVVSGDVPLVLPRTLRRLIDAAGEAWGAMAVAVLEEPGSLGRVIAAGPARDRLQRIVEAADAGPEELAIQRINAGLYALPAPEIFSFLAALETDNAKGELYLTDALGAAVEAGRDVTLVELEQVEEGFGVNNREELALAHRRLLDRKTAELSAAGVTVLDPARTVIEPGVQVGSDTVIHPGVTLLGGTVIGDSCELFQGAWLRDASLGDGVTVLPYSVLDEARVASGCSVGPFARLRPGAVLAENVKIGNFVEIKASRLGAGVKAGHLTYIGNAEVGDGANIGAGTVTCNYDGRNKHTTEIGRNAFIGSDTMLVAPVRVGDGASTGAGSVITQDVPDGALAVGRARQRTLPGWNERLRKARVAAGEEEAAGEADPGVDGTAAGGPGEPSAEES